ncbi:MULTISPECIES: DUF58 domain-containing protein [Sulfurimonas]|uniref:DUF58 domain-containing protein n=1 Tax=Sulfurimonas diazotrophicus TaxID=3131939 RepID=A0ABZ3HCM5_9BACT
MRRRVRQRATRFSLLVVVLLFGLFLEAYMHNFNLVYITLFFVFASAFAAGPLGLRNLGCLEAEPNGCDRLFARRTAQCHFKIRNTSALGAWAVELHGGEAVNTLPEVAPHTTLNAALPLSPERRGRFEAGPCTLQSLFPLSTVRFVLEIAKSCERVVYPEPRGEPLRSFLLRQRSPFGDETDFEGLRSYSGAESPSRIHWPSVARGELAVKSFDRERRTESLQFDFARSGRDDEARLSQLTLWALECEAARLPFTILMPRKVLDSKKEGIDAILGYLALY